LKAWNRVIDSHPEWSLLLAGKVTKNKEYLHCFDLFPNLRSKVQFLGEVKDQDLPALYENAYAAISPSLYEGFGFPPLEAMAMGCPSIVSQVASYAEVCGEASLYINPYDEADIARKVISLIESASLRSTLSQKGSKRVGLFAWKKAAEAHIDLMNGVISK
jgi:glycosyltransferase involved in cell wall biosynthesis